MRRFLALPIIALLGTGTASATDLQTQMQGYLDSPAMAWVTDPMLVTAVVAQNMVTGAHSAAEVNTLDQTWRAEVGTASTPLIDAVLSNETAEFLRAQVAASGGAITEIIVMDAQGLNVAVSQVTSDYWQGDEEKHAMTYGVGPDAVHFGEVELDESSQRYQGQVSLTLVDPATGDPIGAITVGLDALSLS